MTLTGEFGCGTCPARWGGTSTAHCSRCHLTFSGVTGFDFHQVGERCRSKRELFGLGYRETRPGVLGLPTPAREGQQ